jgi:membrane fusion protein (multidrug efflux system)
MRSVASIAVVLSLACTAAGLSACGEPPHHGPPPATIPEVGTIVLHTQPVVLTSELPGRTAPVVVADVRPQVSGLVLSRNFTEGAEVAAGTLLYQIDPATYQAQVESAKAALAKSRANLRSLKLKAQRYAELVAIKAVSQQDNEDTASSMSQAEADVASSQASLDTALINLRYTRIVAPVSGRIGKSTVTPGALVTSNQTTALATVQKLDPIYVDISQSSTEFLRLKHEFETGQLGQLGRAGSGAAVTLKLEDGSAYPLPGTLEFSDVTVDQNTGALTLRAVFPNPKRELLPGMFVRAVLQEGVDEHALLVPQAAVSRDANGNPTAYVVGADDKLQLRPLQTDRAIGDRWVVKAGLSPGDRLVVDGQQRAAPGVAVIVVPLPSADVAALAAHRNPSTGR